jgi:glucans biosynthesis protein
MYWFSETVKPTAVDWRPGGARFRRPRHLDRRGRAHLAPAQQPAAHHRLLVRRHQSARLRPAAARPRLFDHYQDGVYYERRPSLWIEPIGDWGKGAVQLIEIPTDDEIHDNIVAAWVPEKPQGGRQFRFPTACTGWPTSPIPTPLARIVATRMGNGGQPGQPRPKGVRKFMVEFRASR